MRLHERNYTNEILARELQHRSKNTCAVLEVIVRKSLVGHQDLATKVFGRIKAMMDANEPFVVRNSPLDLRHRFGVGEVSRKRLRFDCPLAPQSLGQGC